jgi:prepilin-type N-terminal cleavage/methylation domain-containing protein
MRRKSLGFSMLEILVVLLLMGIIVAIALPGTLSALKGYRLHSDATAVSSYLNVVRMKAASQFKPYRLVVNTSAGTYTMEKLCGDTPSTGTGSDANCTAPYYEFSTPVYEGGTQYVSQGNTFSSCRPSSITGTTYPGTIIGDPTGCPSMVYIYFNTRGSPVSVDSSGNSIPLPNGGAVLYMRNQNNLVDAITVALGGRVSVSSWSGSAWVVR